MTTSKRISARLSALQPSATLAVDAKAKALKAAGESVIGFGAGEPDFPTPDHIVAAAREAAADPANHKYTPAAGLPELRAAIAKRTLADSGVEVDPANIVVTNGGKQAIFQAFAALLDPGDIVVVPAPYWTTYPEAIRLNGGVVCEYPASSRDDFKLSRNYLSGPPLNETRALVLCSPSNPTGAVYTPEELRDIARWAIENDVWIVADEIYEHLVYEGQMSYILAEAPELRDRTIVCSGVAKSYAMTGWRVGWMHGPKDIMAKVANLQSHMTSNVSNVAQRAAIAALEGDQQVVADMRAAFDRRRLEMVERLSNIPGFKVFKPSGAFYVFADITYWFGKDLAGQMVKSSAHLAEIILEEAKVAVVPGEAFGAHGYLRFSYALSDAELDEGLRRLEELLVRP